MKVMVTAQGDGLDAVVDPRFGRARWLLVVDTATGAVEALDNSATAEAAHGAGNETARRAAAAGVAAVITGNVGPNAMRTLQAAGIPVYTVDGRVTAREALDALAAGTLPRAEGPTVAGWS